MIDLAAAARRALVEHGFEPEFTEAAREEAAEAREPAGMEPGVRDLRHLLWSAIDNIDTRDLDQVEWTEALPDGATRVLVAIADVDALVPVRTAIDDHAARNTTSVYTGVATFPMLPERLSTGLTSLREGEDRYAVVIEFTVDGAGNATVTDVYRALVRNRAALAYESVGAWLEGKGAAPAPVAADAALAEQLRMQDAAASRLRQRRHQRGALELETVEARPVMEDGRITGLEVVLKSRARELIEDFMIAANVAMAKFLEERRLASLRRVVRTPERWPRIVELARAHGATLPAEPDREALAAFLRDRRQADPARFAELSLSVVKLLGAGDYVVERPGEDSGGHFALAVDDYTHATAPNRRFADLVTQRQVKSVLDGGGHPYADTELDAIAAHCTEREDEAKRVERVVRKVAAAALLVGREGQVFDAIVTGTPRKGTFVRLLHPAVEGRIVQGDGGVDVGDRVRVRLLSTDAEKGFVDFARVP